MDALTLQNVVYEAPYPCNTSSHNACSISTISVHYSRSMDTRSLVLLWHFLILLRLLKTFWMGVGRILERRVGVGVRWSFKVKLRKRRGHHYLLEKNLSSRRMTPGDDPLRPPPPPSLEDFHGHVTWLNYLSGLNFKGHIDGQSKKVKSFLVRVTE